MHIAYFSPMWPPTGAANGVVTYVSVIRDHLLKQGHEVSVLADDTLHLSDGGTLALEPQASSWAAATVRKLTDRLDRRVGHHPFTGLRMARQLRRARRTVPIDLVEMEESFGWCGAVQRGLDVPVVTRLHGPQFLKPAGSERMIAPGHADHRERAEGRAIRAAAALTAPTRVIFDATCERYRRPTTRGKVIPNPVFAATPHERWTCEGSDRDLILFVGRLDRLKGADVMVSAFARVLAERPTARLKMVGPEGQIEQPDETTLAFIEHAARVLPAETLRRISFEGLLAPERIRILRREAGLTVVASRCENFPYAAIEAMAAGSPLVSTAWLGASEIIDDAITGWITPIGDAGQLAARILDVLAHPAAAAAAGDAAWRHCRRVYAVEQVGGRMIDFYEDIIARSAL